MTLLEELAGGLIVSCQAYPGEPMRDAAIMARVAESAVIGGARGIRAQGIDDIRQIRAATSVPLIGLLKEGDEPVFITPTVAAALAVARAGSDIVALDATRRPRPGGGTLRDAVRAVHEQTGALVLGDVGSAADAEYAVECGVDAVATTLAGYTGERPASSGPDLALVAELADVLPVPVLAEGRYRTPEEASAAQAAGAHAVIIGSAITHPARITAWFLEGMTAERG